MVPPKKKQKTHNTKKAATSSTKDAHLSHQTQTLKDTDSLETTKTLHNAGKSKGTKGSKKTTQSKSSKSLQTLDKSKNKTGSRSGSPPKSLDASPSGDYSEDENLPSETGSQLTQASDPKAPLEASSQEITQAMFDQEGWYIADVPDDMRRCFVGIKSRIEPPMVSATYPDKALRPVLHHVHYGFRRLFWRVRQHAEYVWSETIVNKGFFYGGHCSSLCALGKEENGRPAVYRWPRSNAAQMVISVDELAPAPDLVQLGNPPDRIKDAGKHFVMCRVVNNHTNRIGTFIVNSDLENLAINESAVGVKTIVGPLPNFSVITIGPIAAFWWCTDNIWGYAPINHGDALRNFIGPPLQSHGQTKSGHQKHDPHVNQWSIILQRGLEDHKRTSAADKHLECHRIAKAADMTLADVWLAIGSVWEALRTVRGSQPNSYAGEEVFDPYMYQVEGIVINRATRPGQRFIMPLFLPPALPKGHESKANSKTEKQTGKMGGVYSVGHLMLAVAHPRDKPESKVQVECYDSLKKHVKQSDIVKRVRKLIEISNWAKVDDQDVEPTYASNKYLNTPQQKHGSNTCGLYTVLNAWAIMLGIPLHTGSQRRVKTDHDLFMEEGLTMINLALAGHMNSRTIQAFINVHGISTAQDPDNNKDTVRPNIPTSRMHQRRLQRKLHAQRCRELGFNPENTSTTDTVFSNSKIEILEQHMAEDRDEAIGALKRAGGDLEAAAEELQEYLHSDT